MSVTPVLETRTLNRTLLQRHRLLERVDAKPLAMVKHLAGLQAQNPHDPYITLWSRLRDFDPTTLSTLLSKRRMVRATLMRGTIHLVTPRDCLAWRPLMQSRLERTFWGQAWGRMLEDVDLDELRAVGVKYTASEPRSTKQIQAEIGARFPGADANALSMFVKYVVPLVQTPPRGLWGTTASPAWTSLEHYLGKPMTAPRPDRFFLRYLEAFGPASVADFRAWSGVSGYTDVVEKLRPRLRSYRDSSGRELLDVAGGEIADPDIDAPPRFFPDYDNLFIGHQDRSRIIDRRPFGRDLLGYSSFAVDGFIAGTWKITKRKASVLLEMEPWHTLRKKDRAGLLEEAEGLIELLAPGRAKHELRVV